MFSPLLILCCARVQGAGNLNVYGAFEILSVYQPRVTIFPSEWDITTSGCPYFWPFCTQPLYAGAQPVILNSTILNGMNELGKVVGDVRVTSVNGGAGCLKIAVEHSKTIWPWSGHIALILTVDEKCRMNPKTTEEITLAITVASPPSPGSTGGVQTSTATMKLKADIVPTPAREKRILWDQYHNIQVRFSEFIGCTLVWRCVAQSGTLGSVVLRMSGCT